MPVYKIENEENGSCTLVDTEKAKNSWEEETRWNGNNHISIPTGSQWIHEKLHLSAKDNWYIEQWSQWQGSTPSARFVSKEDAARWLLSQEIALPPELEGLEAELTE